MGKVILLASFIFPERLDWFLNYLKTNFGVEKNGVFCYKNLLDEGKLIITFKIILENGKRLDLKESFPNAVLIHKKGNAIYTINGLNKLIEERTGSEIGNIDYKSIKIDWSEYQNKMILVNGNKLSILNIERVF